MGLKIVKSLEEHYKDYSREIRGRKGLSLNKLVVSTWRWLKVNDIKMKGMELPELRPYGKQFLSIEGDTEDADIKPILDGVEGNKALLENLRIENFEGISKELVELGEAFYNSGIAAYLPKNKKLKAPVMIEYILDDENNVVIDHNIIVADENSEITIIVDISSNKEGNAFHNGVTKVFAKKHSVANVVKIQRINDNAEHFDSNIAFVEDGGRVNWITVELGSKTGVSNYVTNLEGTLSEGNLGPVYFADGERQLDVSYTMIHKGMRSLSNIQSKCP